MISYLWIFNTILYNRKLSDYIDWWVHISQTNGHFLLLSMQGFVESVYRLHANPGNVNFPVVFNYFQVKLLTWLQTDMASTMGQWASTMCSEPCAVVGGPISGGGAKGSIDEWHVCMHAWLFLGLTSVWATVVVLGRGVLSPDCHS